MEVVGQTYMYISSHKFGTILKGWKYQVLFVYCVVWLLITLPKVHGPWPMARDIEFLVQIDPFVTQIYIWGTS